MPGEGTQARYTHSMAESGFYRFGRLAGVKYRRAKWMWDSVAGSEEDSIRAEFGVGQDMAAIVRDQSPAGTDASVQALLDTLCDRLARSVRNPLHRFHVHSVIDDSPSAFALPGGFIFVSESLVELCGANGGNGGNGGNDELAFVVAHEMSHVIRRHAIERILSEKALSAAAFASPGRGVLVPWIQKVGRKWLERAYSRENELDADELGARLTQASGFDPAGAVRLLRRLAALPTSGGGVLGAYLSTHPPVDDRIANLRRRLELGP